MRSPDHNIFIVIVRIIRDVCVLVRESLLRIFTSKTVETLNMSLLESFFHHIFVIGPKKFREHPTAYGVARALWTPILYFFSYRKNEK